GTVHLLLALLSDEDRMTSNVFLRLGVRSEDLRAELLRQLRADGSESAAASEEAPAAAESAS
ncbi:MAG: Clp protease N-terminal domain-containing protein, partial [Planctomycetota bacterium]